MMTLLSNNSEIRFTPDELRALAQPGPARVEDSRFESFQFHQLEKRLGTETLQHVIERYEAGESARSLARELGVAASALVRLMRERNVVVRQKRIVTAELAATLAAKHKAGATMASLEDEYGLSHGAVFRAIHRT